MKPYLDIEAGALAEHTLQDVADSEREDEELAALKKSMDAPATEASSELPKSPRGEEVPVQQIDDLASYIARASRDS